MTSFRITWMYKWSSSLLTRCRLGKELIIRLVLHSKAFFISTDPYEFLIITFYSNLSKKAMMIMEVIRMSDYALEVKDLTKKFNNQIAVNHVSLRIRKNSVYGLLGPNGAGKSTLLKMITGMMKPTSGDIYIEDHLWTRQDLRNIWALIEHPTIYPNLTARENLNVACTIYGLPKTRIEEVLQIIGLEHSAKKRVKNFSMGMKQRLGLGIAIIHNPKLLILDEPTNGLDPIGIEELRALITALPSNGITVILSSHILSEVAQVADEIGIISNGVIGYSGKVDPELELEKLFMEIVARNRGVNEC